MKKIFGAFSAVMLLSACASDYPGAETKTASASDKVEIAAADPNATFLLSEVSCWEASTISEEDSAYLFMMLYGYTAGVKGQPIQDPASVEEIIGSTALTCADNPDMPIHAAMVQHWQ